jgi:hypothetical protein
MKERKNIRKGGVKQDVRDLRLKPDPSACRTQIFTISLHSLLAVL